jgi:hypothetical protein
MHRQRAQKNVGCIIVQGSVSLQEPLQKPIVCTCAYTLHDKSVFLERSVTPVMASTSLQAPGTQQQQQQQQQQNSTDTYAGTHVAPTTHHGFKTVRMAERSKEVDKAALVLARN